MRCESEGRHRRRATTFLGMLLAVAGAAHAADTFNPANRQLSIPSVAIGTSTYTNMVVTVGTIVTAPSGSSANGSVDSYDPQSNLLTVQTVTVGAATYHNAVVTVAALVSCGGVTGADSYSGGVLGISLVRTGSTTYRNVEVTVGSVVSIAGGMPTFQPDTYNRNTNELAVPAVQVGNRVVTNVIVTAGNLLAVGGVSSSLREANLYSFGVAGGSDGDSPQASLIQGSDGNLYGTTFYGGLPNSGTIFSVTTGGLETVQHAFGVGDGANPQAALVQAANGLFYGTAEYGGDNNTGAVFAYQLGGFEHLLYSFGATGSGDGATPQGGLLLASDGNFYGTTFNGGANSLGTVFKLTPNGIETVLRSFFGAGANGIIGDAASPADALIEGSDHALYGTSFYGGFYNQGTVFRITMDGSTGSRLCDFGSSSSDGTRPVASLLLASDGNFYGTTYYGGGSGLGTVFRVTPGGVETVLYSFGANGGTADGSGPVSALIEGLDGNFYGTTYGGGTYGEGTVYMITPDGVENVLYSFGSVTNDGAKPAAALLQTSEGNLYGTTLAGGVNSTGTIFEITTELAL